MATTQHHHGKKIAFPPRLGDFVEICLVGASVWGLPARPRDIFWVVSSYLDLRPKEIRQDERRRHPRITSHAQILSFCHFRASTALEIVACGTHNGSTNVAVPSLACC